MQKWRTAGSLLLSACAMVAAQLPYRLYSTPDGLVRNTVTRIRRDPSGPLWICTPEGLSLFDGSRFTNYTLENGLPDRHVNDVLAAHDGTHWLATNVGIFRFRPRRALIASDNQQVVFEKASTDRSPSLHVMLEDRQGVIWTGGATGLYKVDGSSSALRLEEVKLDPPAARVRTIYEDPKGRIWIGAVEGLYKLDANRTQAALVFKTLDVDGIHMDQQGRLWIGHWGLTCLDPDRTPIAVVEHLGVETSPELGGRVALAASSQNELWIAGGGLWRLRTDARKEDRLIRYDLPTEFEEQFVTALEVDSLGNLWAAANHLGIARMSQQGFLCYTHRDGLASKTVSGVVESRHGDVVVLTNGGRDWNVFEDRRFRAIRPIVPDYVRSMGWAAGQVAQQDRAGDWWMASEYGLLHYPAVPPSRLANVRPIEVVTQNSGLPSSVVLQILADSKGTLWIGTLNGIGVRSASDKHWRSYRGEDLVGFPQPVEAFAEDHSAGVWIALGDRGLIRFRGNDRQLFTRGVPKGINSLFVDSKGRLWITSNRGALGRMEHPDAPQPEIHLYGSESGLASSDLFSVGEDRNGRIYVGGGKGVDRLDPDSRQVRHFSQTDGLPPGLCSQVFRDCKGSLWFASISGLSRYEPGQESPLMAPDPSFRAIRISGETVMISDLGEKNVGGIALQPGQTGIDVELGAVDLSSSGVRFQYLFKGASERWSEPIDGSTLHLAGLSPGHYRLQIRTINGTGMVSSQVALLELDAIAPVWRRWWFQVALAAMLAMITILIHRYRVAHLLELERVRTHIAADLHDDIGASLSQVAVLSEVVRHKSEDRETVQRYSERIAAISREVLASMSDIIWAIDPRHDHLPDLIYRMREFASEICAERGIKMSFDAGNAATGNTLEPNLRRQAFLIFKEAVNNAGRHSGAFRVSIRIFVDSSFLAIEVMDDGKGLSAGSLNGHGLANMRTRTESLKGLFQVEPTLPQGLRVSARLPLGS